MSLLMTFVKMPACMLFNMSSNVWSFSYLCYFLFKETKIQQAI